MIAKIQQRHFQMCICVNTTRSVTLGMTMQLREKMED